MNRLFVLLPNILTSLRLAAAPFLAMLVVAGDHADALAVFAFAGASDAVDGFLAKRFGLATRFGRYFDPAADKLLMLASFVALAVIGAAPVWLAVLVIGRDLGIVFGAFFTWAFDLPLKVAPLPLGKVSTAVQIGYIALLLILLVFGVDRPGIASGAAIVTGALTLASGLNYAALWLRALAARASRTA